ncbi:glycosyltransferase family 2 protein [Pseudalkalibacillus berkeleyi]|uniref:Glycosyltransferase family 2 protein n=1 Tax=Pseudalkalibacillus berkeleyi TaxID=1069813 RepID=A0ABS9GVN6_9BACL|nr:glycosyltransferase family 2 protein [Pseudalkalibacillus berkeleyi]MCF6136872.1 glycosyltransferase family 2 protein [Pseudalkalibacillus berkeleyi]
MKDMVTVVIPSYNPGNYLKEAVESVFNQSHQNWELIIVNDASTDDSLLLISDYLKDPRVQVIHNQKNVGQSQSMNIAIRKINTDFFLMLDSDDWLCENSLELLLKETKTVSEEVALIIGNVKVFNENRNFSRSHIVRNPDWGKSFASRYEILKANLFPWQKFYKTEHILEFGGWPIDDPYNGRHAEDLRMFLLLIEKYKYHWIDKVIYNYRLHDTNSTNKRELYADIVEWIVRDALVRWGNKYEPIFMMTGDGYKLVKDLIPK